MRREEMLKIESYFEAFLLLFLIGAFIYLLKSFIIPLLLAVTFVFLTYRLYKFLAIKIKNEDLAAFIVLGLVLGIVLFPTYLLTISLIDQTSKIVNTSFDIIDNLKLDSCTMELCDNLENYLQTVDLNADYIINKVAIYLSKSASAIFASISKFFINFFVFLLAFYFLLKDGDKLMRYVKRIIPMKNSYKEALFLRFKDVTSAVFIDAILVALMQGALVSIGFWIVGIESFIFWGVIAAFFALIPMIGTPIVWLPAVIFLFFSEEYIKALGLLAYSAIIVGLSDNIVRPLLLKKKIEVHPVLILLSILGGLEVFDFFGIFIGPIIISLLISVLHLYKLDFR